MTEKIKFPIKLKIIAVMTAIIVVSITTFGGVAINLFVEDKTAYIFETSKTSASNLASQVDGFLSRLLRNSLVIYNLVAEQDYKVEVPPSSSTQADLFAKKIDPAALGKKLDSQTRKVKTASNPVEKLKLVSDLAALHLELHDHARRTNTTKNDHLDRAIKLLKEMLETDEKSKLIQYDSYGFALFTYGKLLLANRDSINGINTLKEAVEAFADKPFAPEAHLELADYFYDQRQFPTAIRHYELATKSNNAATSIYARYKLAWVDFSTNNFAQGEGHLIDILKKDQLTRSTRALIEKDLVEFFVESGNSPAKIFSAKSRESRDIKRKRAALQKSRSAGSSVLAGKKLLKQIFLGDPDIIEFAIYGPKGKKRLFRIVHEDHLKQAGLDVKWLDSVAKRFPVDFGNVTDARPSLINSSLKDGLASLTLVRRDPNTGRYLLVRARLDNLLNAFVNEKTYRAALFDSNSRIYAHSDHSLVANTAPIASATQTITKVLEISSDAGVVESLDQDGRETLVGYTKLNMFNLITLSEITREKAFLGAKNLQRKSIYIAITFIALAIIIGVVFAKSLTTNVLKLFEGTKVIASGDFKSKVSIQSQDEIGALASSFNYMAGRIVGLLEQEKDKVRMEEELKVAKLVQDSFFPKDFLQLRGMKVASFYTPSSECGGDWWGCIEFNNKTLLLIGDATGHGVPAALITATAASCANTIKEIVNTYPSLLESPAGILNLLNKAVFGSAQGTILMTFFACLIDPDNNKVVYSNASHNPPYLYKYKDSKPHKRDLKPLMEAVGMRLGHKEDSTYEDFTDEYNQQDVLVMFTDGFVECTNPENEEWGNRKFIKSILNASQKEAIEIRDDIVNDARSFYSGHPLADDLTMVIAKFEHVDAKELPPPTEVAS